MAKLGPGQSAPSVEVCESGAASQFRPTPFAVVLQTAYGQMIINRHDINQAKPLFETGLAIDHEDIDMLARLLRECPSERVVIDVGANFGTYSLALAPVVGAGGAVHAFEPQRIIYNMLAGSVALNSLTHVYCHHAAVGDREGTVEIPQFDYSKPLNFGSIEFGLDQRETLSQPRMHDPARREHVLLTTLDRFGWQRADLIKIDVEGMEVAAILGACQTIARCRPILYVEFLKSDRCALRELIASFDYEVCEKGANYLAVPREASRLVAAAREICAPSGLLFDNCQA